MIAIRSVVGTLALFLCGSLSAQYISGVMSPSKAKVDYDSIRFTDIEASLAATIQASQLKTHLSVIASDEMGGRELGTDGNAKAGEYIAQQFARFGLPKIGDDESYYQKVAFNYTKWEEIGMKLNGVEYKHLKDYLSFPLQNESRETYLTDDIIFLGYGIKDGKYNDYAKRDVRGKTILIYRGEPRSADGVSKITGSSESSDWSIDVDKKLKLAYEEEANLVLIIDDSLKTRIAENRRSLLRPQMTLGDPDSGDKRANAAFISTNILKDMLGKKYKKFIKTRDKINAKGKPRSLVLPVALEMKQKKYVNTVYGNNVMGYVEGIDPELKDEVLVVSAHYDHIGTRGDDINNGADDNGSGTSTVLELAQAFAQAKRLGEGPRRSVLFLLVTGEEKGLLGSYYYAENPVFPIENTIANVNIDMVGRVDKKYQDNPHYVYVIGSDRLSTQLHYINEQKNSQYVNLTMDYKYNDEKDPNRFYFRSDHYNFAKVGIPAIFFFNGTHPDYHRPSDTVEKINFEKMESIARHIFHLSWELVNRDERIVVDRS